MVKQKQALGRVSCSWTGADIRTSWYQRACPQPPLGSDVLNSPRAHGSDIPRRKKTVLGWLCSERDVQTCGGAGKKYAGLLGVKSWDEWGKWTV